MFAWEWSYSRSKLIEECPKAFAFGLKHGPARGGPLNNLRSLHGTAIHEAIAHFIGRWARQETPTADDAIRIADSYLLAQWARRRESIIEAVNGREIDPARFEAIRRRARADLRDFFRMLWPRFHHCRYDTHEKRQYLTTDSKRIAIQIDFSCWAPDGEYYIVDWKTGSDANQRAGAVQLAVYSLWAHQERNVPEDRIRPMVVSTRTGEVTRYRATALDFEFVRLSIDEDHRAVAEYQRNGFPANPEPTRCVGCRHMRLCGPGARAVSEGAIE